MIQQQTGEIDEVTASKALAENLLQTALDYVKTKERIEEDLASTAHKTYEHMKEEERILKDHIVEDEVLDVHVDSYIDERLHHAQETEKEARAEELKHLEKWAKLCMEEEDINKVSGNSKTLKPEYV